MPEVVRRLVVEITDEDEVQISGFGWASTISKETGERNPIWLGGDVPTIVILARQDQLDAPQVVADEAWQLERLDAILYSTAKLARLVAIDPEDDQ